MAGFNFKNKGKLFIFLAAVALISSLFVSGCGQSPKDQTQSSLIDKQNSITTTDYNRRLFFKSSHEQIKFGYAVQSCFVKLGGNFLVDGYNSFCGEYNQNQNISTGSVAYVDDIKINGRNVNITGQVVQVQSCDVDVSQIIDKARQSDNNSVIPPQFIKDGKLKLENNDRLTLPSGVYYFKEIKVSGRAVLGFLGPATVVVEGDVSVDGQGQIKTNPVFLRIISTGKVKVEGQGAIYAGVIGNEVKVDGKGQIFGGVISREFKGEGQGAVHFDKGLGLDKIEVFPSEVTIKVGETVQLTAVAKDIFGNEVSCVAFEWSSSDPSVAVVDQNGLVQGVGEGRAIISANAEKEGYNLAFKGEAIVNVILVSIPICPFSFFPPGPHQYVEMSLYYDSLWNCAQNWWEIKFKFNKYRIEEPGTYYLISDGGAFSWWGWYYWTWCQATYFEPDGEEMFPIRPQPPCYSPPFFLSSSEASNFFNGYVITLTAPKPGNLYVGIGDNPCWDNSGVVYSKVIPAQPYPSFVTVDSRHTCSWSRGSEEYKQGIFFSFEPGKYRLIIEDGGYKNSGYSSWWLWTVNNMLVFGKWRWFVRVVIEGTGEMFDLGAPMDFDTFDDLIAYWKGKYITIEVPPSCNAVWFYVPDDWCDDNVWKMVIKVEKIQ